MSPAGAFAAPTMREPRDWPERWQAERMRGLQNAWPDQNREAAGLAGLTSDATRARLALADEIARAVILAARARPNYLSRHVFSDSANEWGDKFIGSWREAVGYARGFLAARKDART